MFALSRVRPSQVLVVLAAGAVVGAIATNVALASPSAVPNGYKACANAGHRLALQNSHGNCPSNFARVTVAAPGSSGIVSMTNYSPSGSANTSSVWEFLGSPPKENFANKLMAAEVTGTIDQSTNGSPIDEFLGICYERVGGTTLSSVSSVEPEFATGSGQWFAQTVSGAVGNLAPGKYFVGLCAADQGNVLNGASAATVIMAQTASGITAGPMAHAPVRAGRQ